MVQHRYFGMIDIGSNSVRLVVYDALGRVPLPVFNEKVQCALGEGVAATGALNPSGVAKAFEALARFAVVLKGYHVRETLALATAAMRDAQDGPEFLAQVEKRFGVAPRLISGEEEAALAGKAISISVYAPKGVAADLGGGSLELIPVGGGEGHSAPIGVLALKSASGGVVAQARLLADSALDAVPPALWGQAEGETLYAIGGSFRALAKLYVEETGYPLKLLHGFRVPAAIFRNFCGRIVEMPLPRLLTLPGVTRKRADGLAYAALVMRRLIKRSQAREVVFSMYGIREAALYEHLGFSVDDPLLSVAEELAESQGGDVALGQALQAWIAPVFAGEDERWQRLVRSACMLVTIPFYELSAERSEAAFYHVLQSPLPCLGHRERLLLAVAVMVRFQHGAPVPLARWEQLHVPAVDLAMARRIGLALHLAATVSAGLGGLLAASRLVVEAGVLRLEADDPALVSGEVVAKRLQRLQVACFG